MKSFLHPLIPCCIPLSLFFSQASLASPAISGLGSEWTEEKISLVSKQDRLVSVLERVLHGTGIEASINTDIADKVSMKIEGETRDLIFKKLTTAHDLTYYYSGRQIFIDKSSNRISETIKLENISTRSFETHLSRLGLLDDRKNIEWRSIPQKKIVEVAGPESFIEKIKQLSKELDTSSKNIMLVYKWKDRNGVINVTENEEDAPKNATVIEL